MIFPQVKDSSSIFHTNIYSLLDQNVLTAQATFLLTKEDVLHSVLLEATQLQRKLVSSAEKVTIGMEFNAKSYALKVNTSILQQMNVNAQQVNLGQVQPVWLVQAERNSEMTLKLVNVQLVLDGMDSAVQKQTPVPMAENGMFLLSLVNAPLEQLGMELFASNLKSVEEDSTLIQATDVSVLRIHILRMVFAKVQGALEVKSGMDKVALANQVITGMELYVFSVSMGKNGIIELDPACAQKDSNGMEISAKDLLLVEEVEFITKITKYVYVLKEITGMAISVLKSQNVVVDRDGTNKLSNAIVLKTLIGMEKFVSFVLLEKYLIQSVSLAFALLEQYGTTNSAQ